jgi:hypothetical protein
MTSGALGPEKSYWYMVSFNWSGGRWTYAPVTKTPATLYMYDINGIRKAVQCISPHEAEETLGIWIAPNGSTDTQFRKLMEKANLWADHMRMGRIKKTEAWLALQSTIWQTFCW